MRMMNNVRDNLAYNDGCVYITSGSFGEGLDMVGSDIDLMLIEQQFEVHENMRLVSHNKNKTYFATNLEDTRPGFAYLSLEYTNDGSIIQQCIHVSGKLYISNVLFKRQYANTEFPIDHGPCSTNKHGTKDFAFCLHSKSWIASANQWITRPHNVWPSTEVKRNIIDHGVLFVPIGVKGSTNEEIGWRISFSVGEKLLIYSFRHTQLICYVLMKILLSGVINQYEQCKGLLCSYFLKTIIFWISEEVPQSEWTPNNLIPCFMRCLRRLVYCVQYSVCPHYFIPENNLFENKVEGPERQCLLNYLNILLSYGWSCILSAFYFRSFQPSLNPDIPSGSTKSDFIRIIQSRNLTKLDYFIFYKNFGKRYAQAVTYLSRYQSTRIKRVHLYYMSVLCRDISQEIQLTVNYGNKFQFNQYKICLFFLLQNIHHDAVSGWLMLASFFYEIHQYTRVLKIISYSLSKCTLDKMCCCQNRADLNALLTLKSLRKLGIFKALTIIQVIFLSFKMYSPLIPIELEMEVDGIPCNIPTVVYANLLRVLCHFHLHDVRQCRESIKDLQLTIDEGYLMPIPDLDCNTQTSASYICLGVAFRLLNERECATAAFRQSLVFYNDPCLAFSTLRRLSINNLI